MYLDISRSDIVIDTISDSLRTLVSFRRHPNETAFPSLRQNLSEAPNRWQIRDPRKHGSRSGADATIKKFISRARIRAQWQIYRFQPSPSSSTERILRAEGAHQRLERSRSARQIAPRLFTLRVCNLFVSSPTLSYRSLSLSPLVFARHRIFTLLPLGRLLLLRST